MKSKLIMGPHRMSEALSSCGLQMSDAPRVGKPWSTADVIRLWRALERACDSKFVVDLPIEGQGAL